MGRLLTLFGGGGGGNGQPEPSARVVAVDGDSFLAAGVPAGTALHRMLRVGYGDGVVTAWNFAVGGQTLSGMDSAAAAPGGLDSKLSAVPGAANLLLFGGGWLNQLNGFSFAETDTYARAYATARRAAGWTLRRFHEQVTAYDEATLAEVGGDAGALAWLLAWETPDPTFTAASRDRANHAVDSDPTAYADGHYDWRDGGDWEDRFHTREAYSRHPLYYNEPSGATSGGRSHVTQFGQMKKLVFALPSLATDLVLPAPHATLTGKLVEFWPLFDDGAASGVAPYKQYWCGGYHTLYVGSNAAVNDDHAELGGGGLFAASWVGTSASGATRQHVLSRANFPAFSVFGDVVCLSVADAGGRPRNVCGVWHHANTDNQWVVWHDTAAARLKLTTSRDGGVVNTDTVTDATPVATGQRYWFAAGVGADGKGWISVNGAAKTRSASALTVNASGAEEFRLGFGEWLGFGGEYRDFGFAEGELTDSEIAYLHNGGTRRTTLFGEEA